MTEVSNFTATPMVTWYQQASALTGYLWCEIGGAVVAGSQTVPTATSPAQTGVTYTDLLDWVKANIQAMTGIAPHLTYACGVALDTTHTWGIAPCGTSLVSLGYTDDFTFGTLAIPAYSGTPRVWKFRIEGRGNAEKMSPGKSNIDLYTGDTGDFPKLQVLELVTE